MANRHKKSDLLVKVLRTLYRSTSIVEVIKLYGSKLTGNKLNNSWKPNEGVTA